MKTLLEKAKEVHVSGRKILKVNDEQIELAIALSKGGIMMRQALSVLGYNSNHTTSFYGWFYRVVTDSVQNGKIKLDKV